MSNLEDFLSTAEEQEIINAIREAERNTSGEIRVHIEKTTEKNALERAKEVFYFLKMDETEQQNGILFYIAVDDHKFSVLGDTGINKAVTEGFWNSIKDIVIQHFSSGNYVKGLQLAITQTGEKLKEFFPHQSRDSNELSDEISLGQF